VRVLIDTSAYAHLRRGHPPVVEILARAEIVLVSTITLGELEAGFLLGNRPEENRIGLQDFLSESFVRVLEVTADVARRYGRLFARLRNAGRPLPINDVWIAACAEQAGAHLVTYDSDFARVPDLEHTVLPQPARG
jgi:tRNA(fMet)-specific endonuclease VapC